MAVVDPYEGYDLEIEPQDENPGHPYLAAGLQFAAPFFGIPWGPPGVAATSALGGLGAAYLRGDKTYGPADMAMDAGLGFAGAKYILKPGANLLKTFGKEATAGAGFSGAQTLGHNAIHDQAFDSGQLLQNMALGAGIGGTVGTGMHAVTGKMRRPQPTAKRAPTDEPEPGQMDLPLGQRAPTPAQFDEAGQGNLFSNEARFGTPPPPRTPPPPGGGGISGGGGGAARAAMDRAVRLVTGRLMKKGEGMEPEALFKFLQDIDEPNTRRLLDVWERKNLTAEDLMHEILGRAWQSSGRTRRAMGGQDTPPPVSPKETQTTVKDRVVAQTMQNRDIPTFDDTPTGATTTPPPQAPPSPAGATAAVPRPTGPLTADDIRPGAPRTVTKPQKGSAMVYTDPKTGQEIIIARMRSRKEEDAALKRFDKSVLAHVRVVSAREAFNLENKGQAVNRVVDVAPPPRVKPQAAAQAPVTPPPVVTAPPVVSPTVAPAAAATTPPHVIPESDMITTITRKVKTPAGHWEVLETTVAKDKADAYRIQGNWKMLKKPGSYFIDQKPMPGAKRRAAERAAAAKVAGGTPPPTTPSTPAAAAAASTIPTFDTPGTPPPAGAPAATAAAATAPQTGTVTYRITGPEISGGITVNEKGVIVASTPVFKKFRNKPDKGLRGWLTKKWPTTTFEATTDPLESLNVKRGQATPDAETGPGPVDYEDMPGDIPDFESLSTTRPDVAPAPAAGKGPVTKIISGAQTGADRGGLDAAMALGVEHGGWVPKGRRSEDGTVPPKYNVQEHESPDYPPRTASNVRDSDGTVIFEANPSNPGRGTKLTQAMATQYKRPHLVIGLDTPEADAAAVATVRDWLTTNNIKTLNVAGTRESHAPGVQARVQSILQQALAGEAPPAQASTARAGSPIPDFNNPDAPAAAGPGYTELGTALPTAMDLAMLKRQTTLLEQTLAAESPGTIHSDAKWAKMMKKAGWSDEQIKAWWAMQEEKGLFTPVDEKGFRTYNGQPGGQDWQKPREWTDIMAAVDAQEARRFVELTGEIKTNRIKVRSAKPVQGAYQVSEVWESVLFNNKGNRVNAVQFPVERANDLASAEMQAAKYFFHREAIGKPRIIFTKLESALEQMRQEGGIAHEADLGMIPDRMQMEEAKEKLAFYLALARRGKLPGDLHELRRILGLEGAALKLGGPLARQDPDTGKWIPIKGTSPEQTKNIQARVKQLLDEYLFTKPDDRDTERILSNAVNIDADKKKGGVLVRGTQDEPGGFKQSRGRRAKQQAYANVTSGQAHVWNYWERTGKLDDALSDIASREREIGDDMLDALISRYARGGKGDPATHKVDDFVVPPSVDKMTETTPATFGAAPEPAKATTAEPTQMPKEQRIAGAFKWATHFGKAHEDQVHAAIKLGDSDVVIADRMGPMFASNPTSAKWNADMRQRYIRLLRDGGRYGNPDRQAKAITFATERGVLNAILNDIDSLPDEAILSGTIGKMLSNMEPEQQRNLLGYIRASKPAKTTAEQRMVDAIRGGDVTPGALMNADQQLTVDVADALEKGMDPDDFTKMWAIINNSAEQHPHVRQALDVWQREIGGPNKIVPHFVSKARSLADDVGVDLEQRRKLAIIEAQEAAERKRLDDAEKIRQQDLAIVKNDMPEAVGVFENIEPTVPAAAVRVKTDVPPPSYTAEVGENINLLMPHAEIQDRMAVKQLLLDAWRAETDQPVKQLGVKPEMAEQANMVLASLTEPAGFTLEFEGGKLMKRPIPGEPIQGEQPKTTAEEVVQSGVSEKPEVAGNKLVYGHKINAESAARRMNMGLSQLEDAKQLEPEFIGKRYFATKLADGTGWELQLRPIGSKHMLDDQLGFFDISGAARLVRDAYGAIKNAFKGIASTPDVFERERRTLHVPRDQWQHVPPAKPRTEHHEKRATRDRRFKQRDFDSMYKTYDRDTADMMAELVMEKAPEVFEQTRNIQPVPRMKALADREAVVLNKLFPKGTVKNAEQNVALMLATARARVHASGLAEKFDNGTLTMAEQLELPRAVNDWMILALNDKGQSAELGRAMAIRRWFKVEMADAMRYEPDKIMDIVKSYRGRMKLMAEQLRSATSPEEQSAILYKFASGDWHNKLRSFLFGNLLSSPKTQIRNTVGNTMRLVFELGSEPFAVLAAEGARGLKKMGAGGKLIDAAADSDFHWDNIPAEWVGLVDGFKEGLVDFNFTMKHGFNPQMLRHIDTPTLLEAPRAEFAGGIANPYNLIPRVMEATDAFFRRAAYRKHLTGWAYTAARNDLRRQPAMSNAAKKHFMETRMSDYMIDVPKDVENQAWDFASRMVFQEDPPDFARRMMALKHSQHGKLGATFWDFFIPFVRTPANILRQGLIEFSPAGMIPKAERTATGWQLGPWKPNAALTHAMNTGDKQGVAKAYGRALLGSVFAAAGVMAHKSGRMTAGIPKDEGDRAQWYAEKKIPNAFHVPIGPEGKYIGHSFLGPASILLSAIAAVGEGREQAKKERSEKPWEDLGTGSMKVMTNMIYALTEQSYLQGLKYLGDLLNNPEQSAVTLAKQAGGFAVPMSSFNRAANMAMDPTVRSPGTATEAVQMSMLGKGNELAPRIDRWGDEVKRTGTGALGALNRFASPVENQDAGPVDPVDIEMGRIGAKIGDPKRVERILNRNVTMPKEISPYVQKFRRKALYGAITELINSPRYQQTRNDYAKLELVERERRKVSKRVSEQIKPVLVKYILDKARKNSKQRVIPSADEPRGQIDGESRN